MRLVWDGRGKGAGQMGVTVPPQFAQMEGYWQALRPDGRSLPHRADFDPRGIADLLDCTLLLERIAPGQVRIRLAGMAVCDMLGMDVRGMPLTALMVPAARAALSAHMERVFAGPAIARLRLEGERGFMQAPCGGQLLVLPMLGRTGQPDRALACLVTDTPPGRTPRRFALSEGACRPISGVTAAPAVPQTETRRSDASPQIQAGARPMVPGLAESPAIFVPAVKRQPHLRLIKG